MKFRQSYTDHLLFWLFQFIELHFWLADDRYHIDCRWNNNIQYLIVKLIELCCDIIDKILFVWFTFFTYHHPVPIWQLFYAYTTSQWKIKNKNNSIFPLSAISCYNSIERKNPIKCLGQKKLFTWLIDLLWTTL